MILGSDIDEDSGVAAVRLARHPGSPDSAQHMFLFERIGDWRYLGAGGGRGRELSLAGRPSVSQAGSTAMMTAFSGCSGRSRADREGLSDHGDYTRVEWVTCAGFRLATEVACLQVGARQITVPPHGYVIVSWKAPPSPAEPARPPIAAIGADGSQLTELGSGNPLDSLTWAAIEAAIAGD